MNEQDIRNRALESARAKFEAWYCDVYWNFKSTAPNLFRADDGTYDHLSVQLAWNSWQEAIKSQPTAPVGPLVGCGDGETWEAHWSAIQQIVDRDTPPDNRDEVVDHDIAGKPITRGDVEKWSKASGDDVDQSCPHCGGSCHKDDRPAWGTAPIRCGRMKCKWRGYETELLGIPSKKFGPGVTHRVCPICGCDNYMHMTEKEIAAWKRAALKGQK